MRRPYGQALCVELKLHMGACWFHHQNAKHGRGCAHVGLGWTDGLDTTINSGNVRSVGPDQSRAAAQGADCIKHGCCSSYRALGDVCMEMVHAQAMHVLKPCVCLLAALQVPIEGAQAGAYFSTEVHVHLQDIGTQVM